MAKMTQNQQFAILLPLVVGAGVVVCTILVHALAVAATVNFLRHERKLGHAGALIDLAIFALVITFAFGVHLIEIAFWAVLLLLCGEFQEFGTAYYLSAVNYTTLGYGDLLLTPPGGFWDRSRRRTECSCSVFRPRWSLLFAVIQRLVLARFKDLRC